MCQTQTPCGMTWQPITTFFRQRQFAMNQSYPFLTLTLLAQVRNAMHVVYRFTTSNFLHTTGHS